jgi:hypothetical protein
LPNLNAELEDFAMDPGSAPHVARNNWRISSGTWSAAATSRLPSPERTKTGTMPPDNRLRLDDHQGIHNARRNPIEGGKNQTIEIAEGEPLRRFSSQHIEPMAQRQDLRFELNP